MWAYWRENQLDELASELSEQLGRELTARERFYIALSESVTQRDNRSEYEEPGQTETTF